MGTLIFKCAFCVWNFSNQILISKLFDVDIITTFYRYVWKMMFQTDIHTCLKLILIKIVQINQYNFCLFYVVVCNPMFKNQKCWFHKIVGRFLFLVRGGVISQKWKPWSKNAFSVILSLFNQFCFLPVGPPPPSPCQGGGVVIWQKLETLI